MVQAPLLEGGARSEGEVRLSISKDALSEELEELRRSLWVKISIAGALALAVLLIGLV